MTTSSDVLLTADDARVTVLRSLASSAFGAWVLELPDKIEVEDLYPPSAPGNEPGFVAALPVSNGRVGGLARRFVRADVKITVEGDDEDQLGDLAGLGGSTSTVDRVLSEAADRVSGEFFLESDISKAGLNGWVPLVDFEVGDLVWVRVLGRLVRLPVTRIDPVVSEHDVVDWTVHVGGQVVSDDDARLAENDVVRAALVQDRRELAGVVGGLSRRVSRAQGTADGAQVSAESAQGTADLAVSRASELESFLAGGGDGDLVGALAAINKQLAAQDEPAASGLVPAYLRINAQLWEAQKLINEQQKLIDAAQTSALEAQRKAVKAQAGLIGFEHFRNHGEFYITPFIEKSNIFLGGSIFGAQTYVFNFDGVSGTPVGCRSVRRDGKGMVEILESGVWEFRARVRLRGAVGFSEGDFSIERYSGSSGGGDSPTLVGTNGSGTYEWSGVREMRRGDVVCVTVSSMASSFMGMFGGPSWTLLLCRQISRS